ncbi:MAG TPA: ABC transporter substrate-binding protein [Hyphomicrobiales bacterium]|nr:ABC transporter substrate-binding protein [Hyphomicrobiales bacterium]
MKGDDKRPGAETVDRGRRNLIKAGGAVALAAAANLPLPNVARAASNTIKVGYIEARSGFLSQFNVVDDWVYDQIKPVLKDGLKIGGKTYQVELVKKDNQSDDTQTSRVMSELVLRENCDIVLGTNGSAVVAAGPLADARGMPLLTTNAPWEAFVIGRGARPGPGYKGFPFHFHIGFGVADLMDNYVGMWNTVETNKTVGTLWMDNPAGRSFGGPVGLSPHLAKGGYKEVKAGFFQPSTNDFSNQLSAFKNGKCDIVVGYLTTEQLVQFWNQAAQTGYKPKVATVAAALLFPSAVEALGNYGDGLSTEVWWTPAWPYKSSLTGQSAREFADSWEKSTGKQWTQPLGYVHQIWEAAIAALKASGDPKDKKAVRDAIKNLDITTVAGPVNFKTTKVPNVAIVVTCGGQWVRTQGGKFKYDLLIVSNSTAPNIPIQAKLKLLS